MRRPPALVLYVLFATRFSPITLLTQSAMHTASIPTGLTQDLLEPSSTAGHEQIVPADVPQIFDRGQHALIGDECKLWMLTFNTDDPATRP